MVGGTALSLRMSNNASIDKRLFRLGSIVLCVDMCLDMCIDMCIAMCVDIRVDMGLAALSKLGLRDLSIALHRVQHSSNRHRAQHSSNRHRAQEGGNHGVQYSSNRHRRLARLVSMHISDRTSMHMSTCVHCRVNSIAHRRFLLASSRLASMHLRTHASMNAARGVDGAS